MTCPTCVPIENNSMFHYLHLKWRIHKKKPQIWHCEKKVRPTIEKFKFMVFLYCKMLGHGIKCKCAVMTGYKMLLIALWLIWSLSLMQLYLGVGFMSFTRSLRWWEKTKWKSVQRHFYQHTISEITHFFRVLETYKNKYIKFHHILINRIRY